MIVLTLKDRYEILALLPQKGDLLTLEIAKGISEKVIVRPEETEQYCIKSMGQGLSWNVEGENAVFDINFTEPELAVLKKEIKIRDEKREIPIGLYNLVLKLIACS